MTRKVVQGIACSSILRKRAFFHGRQNRLRTVAGKFVGPYRTVGSPLRQVLLGSLSTNRGPQRLDCEALGPKSARVSLEVWPESHWPGFALRQADAIQSYTAW